MSDGARLGVSFRTLGCKVNRAESESIATELLGVGVRIAKEHEAAVVVINTCTVTGEADAKARKAVRHALASVGRPIVVVTGCLAALDSDGIRGLGERVVVEADKSRVPTIVAALLGRDASHGGDHVPNARVEGEAFRTRVALKVEDGCDAFCAYCIVPYARGVPRAVPLEDIVAQASALVAAGTSEIVLTGINIGRYDDSGRDLADVLGAVAGTGVSRIRLSSIEPLDLRARLLSRMAETPAFCRHLHVPLQAGSDAVLSAMGRGYTMAQYTERLDSARAALPGLVVTTDILAGFPGETGEQADETLAFCQTAGFGKLHVFRYSRRPGTPAAARADQVPEQEKSSRATALRELSRRLTTAHAADRIGQTAEVLVERVTTDDGAALIAEGTTRDYLRVRFEPRGAQHGQLVTVRLTVIDRERVLGERLL